MISNLSVFDTFFEFIKKSATDISHTFTSSDTSAVFVMVVFYLVLTIVLIFLIKGLIIAFKSLFKELHSNKKKNNISKRESTVSLEDDVMRPSKISKDNVLDSHNEPVTALFDNFDTEACLAVLSEKYDVAKQLGANFEECVHLTSMAPKLLVLEGMKKSVVLSEDDIKEAHSAFKGQTLPELQKIMTSLKEKAFTLDQNISTLNGSLVVHCKNRAELVEEEISAFNKHNSLVDEIKSYKTNFDIKNASLSEEYSQLYDFISKISSRKQEVIKEAEKINEDVLSIADRISTFSDSCEDTARDFAIQISQTKQILAALKSSFVELNTSRINKDKEVLKIQADIDELLKNKLLCDETIATLKPELERLVLEENERLAGEEAARRAREEEERLERERIAREEAERLEKEKAERERLEKERLEREEKERKAKEEAERLAKLEAEKKAKEEAERKAQEKAEKLAKLEAERLARVEAKKLAREKAEQEKLEKKRLAKETAERKALEKAEAERLEKERIARENAEQKATAIVSDVEADLVKTDNNTNTFPNSADSSETTTDNGADPVLVENVKEKVQKQAQNSYVLSFDDVSPELYEKIARGSQNRKINVMKPVIPTGDIDVSENASAKPSVSVVEPEPVDVSVPEKVEKSTDTVDNSTAADESSGDATENAAPSGPKIDYMAELKKQWAAEKAHKEQFAAEQAKKKAEEERRKKELLKDGFGKKNNK